MSLFRFNIQGAIPIPETEEQREWLVDLRARLMVLKSHCVVINEGADNEEHITNFTYHLCGHNDGEPCEPTQEL